MSLKNLIHKKIFLILYPVILLTATIIFGTKFSYLSYKLNTLDSEHKKTALDYKKAISEYEKRAKESLEFKKNYDTLQKDYQLISVDRANLISQIKNLVAFKSRANELEDELAAAKKGNGFLQKDKDKLQRERQIVLHEYLKLKRKLSESGVTREKLREEKEQLESTLAAEREKSSTNKLEKENKALSENVKQSQIERVRLSTEVSKTKAKLDKAEKDSAGWREKTKKLNKDYAEAVRKNKLFEQKVTDTPKKFVELARQNKTLIRQTANMHYNLGVFYTKNREYPRAIAEFEKAIELTPDDAYAHFNLGYIYAEYVVDRYRAIEHFKYFLKLAKSEDKDADWVKKYILTWESYEGKKPMD